MQGVANVPRPPVTTLVTHHHELVDYPVWHSITDTERVIASDLVIQQLPAPTFDEVQRVHYAFDKV